MSQSTDSTGFVHSVNFSIWNIISNRRIGANSEWSQGEYTSKQIMRNSDVFNSRSLTMTGVHALYAR